MSDLAVSYSALQGMVIGADGRITYDFSGHIHAQGLDLDGVAYPNPTNMITWTRPSDLVKLLRIYTGADQAFNAVTPHSSLTMTDDFGGANAKSALQAYIGLNHPNDQFGFGQFVNIMDSDGNSDFQRKFNAQRLLGQSEVYAGPWPGASVLNPIPRNAGSTTFFAMQEQNNHPFWWLVHINLGIVLKNDAAYHYIYTGLSLDQPDQDGLSVVQDLHTQHNSVNVYEAHTVTALFRCAAHTLYHCNAAWLGGSGGSWSVYVGPTEAEMWGVSWPQ